MMLAVNALLPPTLLGLQYRDLGRERPFVDCWGLGHVGYRERFGIRLPLYDTVCVDDLAERAAAFAEGSAAPEWREVPEARAWPGDVILFWLSGAPVHVGYHHVPGQFLHIERGTLSHHAKLDHVRWRSLRRVYHRHRDRTGRDGWC